MPKINIGKNVLNLEITLFNGQSFRWQKVQRNDKTYFYGVARDRVWKLWRENDNEIEYNVLHSFVKTTEDKNRSVFTDYFSLDVNVSDVISKWNEDKYFNKIYEQHPHLMGIRILNQSLFETIISFICSANNNVSRISKMVEKICELYGEGIKCENNMIFYSIPCVTKLAKINGLEETLRDNMFGYRAKYLFNTFKRIDKLGGNKHLETIQSQDLEDARASLLAMQGIGRKVADCILLMGLRHYQVVPCDIHVKRLVKNNYLPKLDEKKFSKGDIVVVQNLFNEKFENYSGWVQSILFTVQLQKLIIK
uniref:DNA-(apurinic or apyrimidinic site) lyase n=1 Tax=Rhabditophanes sp. KR3021 TaxID=114890 RepID=A0AC35TSA0_9BILA